VLNGIACCRPRLPVRSTSRCAICTVLQLRFAGSSERATTNASLFQACDRGVSAGSRRMRRSAEPFARPKFRSAPLVSSARHHRCPMRVRFTPFCFSVAHCLASFAAQEELACRVVPSWLVRAREEVCHSSGLDRALATAQAAEPLAVQLPACRSPPGELLRYVVLATTRLRLGLC